MVDTNNKSWMYSLDELASLFITHYVIKFKSSYAKSTLSKKLNLGLNFSTPSGGVTSPSLKGSMAQTHKLSKMDIQPGGVKNHFLQNVLNFGFGDWKNVYETRRPNPIFPKISRKLDELMGKWEKKYIKREENKYLF